MSILILDIDNCIAEDAWRVPLIRREERVNMFLRYDQYHLASQFDGAARNEDLFRRTKRIVLVTSRPALYRAITEWWLRAQGVPYSHLIMRANEDHRGSVDVKRDAVRRLLTRGDAVALAVDDREDVLAMYREEFGLRTECRAIHPVRSVTGVCSV